MIKESAFGNTLATGDQGIKKTIKGQVSFDKMRSREPLNAASEYAANIYTYADSVESQFKPSSSMTSGHKPLFQGVSTMKNTTGRDDSMYYVSDGFNLKTQVENQFTNLLMLTSQTPAASFAGTTTF